MCKEIILHNKVFVPFIEKQKIKRTVKKMAFDIYKIYKNNTPIFIGILNGVILFFSDILKHYPGQCQIDFVQLCSYDGFNSTGKVDVISGCSIDLSGRDVVIFEDIIDTGNTLRKIYKLFRNCCASSIRIATLFLKKDVFKSNLNIDFVGIKIPNKFIVGYGLDFDNLGRNYTNIYKIKD